MNVRQATPTRTEIIERLQKEVCSMQGFKRLWSRQSPFTGLGPIETAFPEQRFPIGAIHEFISKKQEDAAATNGFIAGLAGRLMKQDGVCLWVSTKCTIFPPALKIFGIAPERILFVDARCVKDALWTIEEALTCESLSAVVGEISQLSFTESRRLQLAVEHSKVTGFIHRYNPRTENIVACMTRWKIKPAASRIADDMPGVGFPNWDVQLVKVRNGKPGNWQVAWAGGNFSHIDTEYSIPGIQMLKTGSYA